MSASISLVTNGDILKTLKSSAGFTDCYNNLLKTLDLPESSIDKRTTINKIGRLEKVVLKMKRNKKNTTEILSEKFNLPVSTKKNLENLVIALKSAKKI